MLETRRSATGRTYRTYTAAAVAAHSGPSRRTASQRIWGWSCPFCGVEGPVPHATQGGGQTGELQCASPACREVWDPSQV